MWDRREKNSHKVELFGKCNDFSEGIICHLCRRGKDSLRNSALGFEELQHVPADKNTKQKEGRTHFTILSFGGKRPPVTGRTDDQPFGTVSYQASLVLLAFSSRVVIFESAELLHVGLAFPLSASNTVFTSIAHTAKDSWTYTDAHARWANGVPC